MLLHNHYYFVFYSCPRCERLLELGHVLATWSSIAGVKRNFWLAKSLTSCHQRMRRVIFLVMHFANGGCSLRYQIYWELVSCAGWNFVSAPAKFKPAPAGVWEIFPAPAPQTMNPNPRPPRTFSVSNPHLSENY